MKLLQWVKFVKILLSAKTKASQSQSLNFNERYQVVHEICQNFYQTLTIQTQFSGLENIPKDEAVYYVSNHQGTFDPLLLIAANPNPMTFISKKENLKLPIISQWGKLIEFITFDRDNPDQNMIMLRQATRTLKLGRSILVFPEGTRSKRQALLPFKAGSLLPAYLANVKIMCVTQNYNHECDQFKKIEHTLSIHFHPPLHPEEFKTKSYEETMEQCVELIASKLETS